MRALGKACETCDYVTGLQAYMFYVQSSLSAPHYIMIDKIDLIIIQPRIITSNLIYSTLVSLAEGGRQ